MDKKLKKRHKLKYLFLGVGATVVILFIVVFLIVQSESLLITFFVSDTGEPLEGSVYLGGNYLGEVDNGKIKLIWESFYPGEIEFRLRYNGEIYPFYFDLTSEDISVREANYIFYQYELEDLNKSVEEYSLVEQEGQIISGINNKRMDFGLDLLKEDYRLEEISKLISEKVISGEIESSEIDLEFSKSPLLEEIFFYGGNSYWFDYYLDSSINVSEDFLEGIFQDNYYSKEFISPFYTNYGIFTSCNEVEKRCFTLLFVTQNKLVFEDSLRREYILEYDPYYLISRKGVGFMEKVNLSIQFDSDEKLKFYVVKSSKDYDKLVERRSVDEIFYRYSKSFNSSILFEPNNTIVLSAGDKNANYNLTLSEVI